MNANEILNNGVGTEERVSNSLQPKKVTIVAVNVETKKKDGNDMKVPLIEFMVKHPDSEDLIKISKVKQLVGDKLYAQPTWYVTDSENKIQKDMPLSRLLGYLDILSINEAVGKEIDTIEESDSSHFLVFKAY